MTVTLYTYWRSQAAFRVRIALNLKGIAVEHASRHLRKGEQASPDYVAINPQKLVPTLVLDSGEIVMNPGDVVVQLGNWHGWTNPRTGSLMAFVMMGGKFEA